MDDIAASSYQSAAAKSGEVRLYVNAGCRIHLLPVRSALGYAFAHERDHRTVTDPWEYAFGDARGIESEIVFNMERDRVIQILEAETGGDWSADFIYYPPAESAARFHWSSTEGTLHPGRTVNTE